MLPEDLHHPQEELHGGGLLALEPASQGVDGGVIHDGCHVRAPQQLEGETETGGSQGQGGLVGRTGVGLVKGAGSHPVLPRCKLASGAVG